MEESIEDEEKIISLMKSLSVRIRKAEEERDSALQRLQQLKSILDSHAHKPQKDESHRPVPGSCTRHSSECTAIQIPNKLTVETDLSPSVFLEGGARDSGLASTLGTTESDGRHAVLPNTNSHPLTSLEFATAINDQILRTPIRVLSRKTFSHGAGCFSDVCSSSLNPGLVSKETVWSNGFVPFEEVLESNTDTMFLNCLKLGGTIVPHIDSESRTVENLTSRENTHRSSTISLAENIPVACKSVLLPSSTSSITERKQEEEFGLGDRLTVTEEEENSLRMDMQRASRLRKASSDTYSVSSAFRGSSGFKELSAHATVVPSTNYHLPQMLHSKWSSLKPYSSDAPIAGAHEAVTTNALPETQVNLCQSVSRQTTTAAELRHQLSADEQYVPDAEREYQNIATRTTSGTVSPTWLRQLISRLELLSNTYHSGHSIRTPAVRLQSEQCSPPHRITRPSSCSPRRIHLTRLRPLRTPKGSHCPALPRTKLRSTCKSTERKSNHINYPVFVPMDEVNCTRSIKSKTSTPSVGSRPICSTKPNRGRAKLSPKRQQVSRSQTVEPKILPPVKKFGSFKSKKSSLSNVDIPLTKTTSDVKITKQSPRILVTDPNGTPHEMITRKLSPVRTYRVRDQLPPKPTTRLYWR